MPSSNINRRLLKLQAAETSPWKSQRMKPKTTHLRHRESRRSPPKPPARDLFLRSKAWQPENKKLFGMANPCRNVTGTATIATMKEKPSHHPKRESRALQTRFGGTEERSIKYESEPRTVNFISVLPLIQKEPGNGRGIIGKISMPDFQIIYPIVKSTYGKKVIDVSSWRRIKLLSCRDSSDQSRSLEGGSTETDCTSDAAYASCLFMLELNFHSGSSIYSNETDEQRLLLSGCFVSRVRRLYACGCVTLLPPPKLHVISPRVFVIGDYVLHLVCFPVFGSVDHFRDVSVRTADIETLGAIYIDCGVPVMLGGPIGSETR
ncbi:hypothetical protein F2Q70_00005897 [Brassica cretica]|uniref:Uncharacterized protein n=1 Tax=Brassica cretica TaxID=69181 RepID=A0A8S9IT71_BRACR|nr:hypothetical protein F2Q70_00005897 [Brassica cretica]